MSMGSIGRSISNQQQALLRGQARSKPDQIRQRELWSSFCFFSSTVAGDIPQITPAGVLLPNEYPIFVTPQGQNGQGYPGGYQLNLRDTNLPGVNRVSDQQNFSYWELGVSVVPLRQDVIARDPTSMSFGDPNPEDVDQLCGNVVLQIVYLTNAITLGLIGDFPSPGGPSIVAPTAMDYSMGQNVAQTSGGFAEGAAGAPWDGRQARASNTGGGITPAPALRRKLDVPIFLNSGDTYSFKFLVTRPIQLRNVKNGGTGGFHLRFDAWAVESFREQG